MMEAVPREGAVDVTVAAGLMAVGEVVMADEAAMVAEDASIDDVEKYFAALRRAQADIDLRPELYTHYYREEFPERFRDQIDTRLFGPGERIVFEDYSKDIYDKSRQWIDERGIFEDGIGERSFEQAVIL